MEEIKIPTSEGEKTTSEILGSLYYSSYKHNRDYGCSHEALLSIGIGNDAFRKMYEEQFDLNNNL